MPIRRLTHAASTPKEKVNTDAYQDGGEGMIRWANDNVWIPIYPVGSVEAMWWPVGDLPDDKHPETNKSYKDMWKFQQDILRECLEMKNGRLLYRLIIFCWQRGEGKSLLTCLVQMWKFLCFPKQQIMLGANSKDQIRFAHYDIMRDTIIHSPNLIRRIGKKNIKEKEICLRDDSGNITSTVRCISSFSGLMPNITGYTFSEMFDMKNPRFFVQLDGSTRTIPNALGIIDSTVSSKQHVLYDMFQKTATKQIKTTYFSYRCSTKGDILDYTNPNMTKTDLDDYRAKYPFGEFERYFLNLWSAGGRRIFTIPMIDEMQIMGVDDKILNHSTIHKMLVEKEEAIITANQMAEKAEDNNVMMTAIEISQRKIAEVERRINPVAGYYALADTFGTRVASFAELEKLGELLNTDFAILGGYDIGDPMSNKYKSNTVGIIIAKGLPNSKSKVFYGTEEAAPLYVYFVIAFATIDKHSVDGLKDFFDNAHSEYDGLDMICGERWGAWDLSSFCEERDIKFEPVYPSYDRQNDAFSEMFRIMGSGRLKCPITGVRGFKEEDLFIEEMSIFDHEEPMKTGAKGWFGSPEKKDRHGIQDDSIFACGWCIYGGRMVGVDEFRMRKTIKAFAHYYSNESDLAGEY